MKYLTLATSLLIALVAAYFSVLGIATIFSGAFFTIVLMTSVLEFAKLVTAAWLHLNWKIAPLLTRIYLTTAVVVLMLITSMGIFGFLSKAHLDQALNAEGNNDIQIQILQEQIESEKTTINSAQRVISQLDRTVETLISYDRIRGEEGALSVRNSQISERESLSRTIKEAQQRIQSHSIELIPLKKQSLAFESEIGPLKYVAELIYGENAENNFDRAVRFIILMLVFVFDPLAIMLLIVSTAAFNKKMEDLDPVAITFSNDNMSRDNILVVDALNLAFRWKHQGRTDFRYDYLQTIRSLAKSYDCERIIITADWGSSSYRKAIAPDYKQNRKDKYAEQSEEERIAFEEFFEEFEAGLELLEEDYPVLRYKGVEADDIAAHLVRHKEKYDLENIWLISSDRDWDLLIQENVSRFSYVTRKEVRLDNWREHYEIPPEQYISLKCLTGDKGDNVPGIPGIGPKRAVQLIRDYGDAMDIYNAIPINSQYKYIQELNQNAEQLLVNYELMDLMSYCDDAIGQENISDISRRVHGYQN